MLTAISHAADIDTGDTRPQLFWCEDEAKARAKWVLKLMGLANVELAADWIGCLLAQQLRLPCPPVDVAYVDDLALATAPEAVQKWAKSGPAFASLELSRSATVQSDSDMLEFATPEELGRMFALDAWLDVLDRRKPDGVWNALVLTTTGSLSIIDYGKGLTSILLPVLAGEPSPSVPNYPHGLRIRASVDAAIEASAEIEAISNNDIMEIMNSIPTEWISQGTRERAFSFLTERAPRVGSVCRTLHEDQPTWS